MANELIQWFTTLEREYVFLLTLPFIVAVIGLWAWWADKEDIDREYEAREREAEVEAVERRQGERRRTQRRRAEDSRITA